MRGLIFLLVVYIIKFILKELSKPVVSGVDQIINSINGMGIWRVVLL
jgi:hypothetical protein